MKLKNISHVNKKGHFMSLLVKYQIDLPPYVEIGFSIEFLPFGHPCRTNIYGLFSTQASDQNLLTDP